MAFQVKVADAGSRLTAGAFSAPGTPRSKVFSGDTLFVGDVGRPDFGGPEGARQQYLSVQKLLELEEYVEVPAHFEGS